MDKIYYTQQLRVNSNMLHYKKVKEKIPFQGL